MYRFSALLLAASMGLTVWIAREVGLFSYTSVDAAEPTNAAVNAPGAEERLKLADKREEDLRKKEQELSEREALLNEQVKRFEKLSAERAVKSAEKGRQLASESARNEVALVYEKMDPKKAAKILENLNAASVSNILNGMRKDKAAEILSRLSADKAKQVTEKLFANRAMGSSDSAVQKVNSDGQ